MREQNVEFLYVKGSGTYLEQILGFSGLKISVFLSLLPSENISSLQICIDEIISSQRFSINMDPILDNPGYMYI